MRIGSQTGYRRCTGHCFRRVRPPPCEDSLTNRVVEGLRSTGLGETGPRHMRIGSQTGTPRSFPSIGPPHLPSDNNAEGLFARVDSRAKSPSNSAIGRKRDYPNWRTIPALLHDCTSTPSARLHLTLTSSPAPSSCRTSAQWRARKSRPPQRR